MTARQSCQSYSASNVEHASTARRELRSLRRENARAQVDIEGNDGVCIQSLRPGPPCSLPRFVSLEYAPTMLPAIEHLARIGYRSRRAGCSGRSGDVRTTWIGQGSGAFGAWANGTFLGHGTQNTSKAY